MAIEYIDGFETYTDASKRWTLTASNYTISGTYARTGSFGVDFNLGSFMANRFKATAATAATVVQAAAVKPVVEHSATPTIFSLYDESTVQVSLAVNTGTGVVSAYRGDRATLLGSSAGGILPADDVFRFVEWKVNIHNTTGSIVVRVNGVTVINLTGINTRSSANNYATHHRIANVSGNQRIRLDDYHVINCDTGAPTDFVGDTRVVPLKVSSAGNSTQFTPSTGSNFQNVDDATPDDDSTYNSSATASQKDTFTLTDSAVTAGTVYGVQVMTRARKDDAGSRTLRNIVRTGGTDYESGDLPVADSYEAHYEVWDQNPGTSTAWTIADLNALEAGYKVEA